MPAKLTKKELKQNLDNSLSSNSISKLYKVVEYPLNKKDIVSITCHLHGEQQKLYGSGGSTLSHFNSSNVSLRYFWVKLNTALTYYHRNYCQKQLLEKHFKEPLLKEDTENSYMERLGFVKVFDNGISTLIV